MKINRLLFFGALLLQTNLFAIQSDTLNLDEVMLKSALINQANPALTVSEISYDEYGIRAVNFQDAIDFSAGLWITNSENQAQDNRMAIRGFGARSAFGIRGLKIILDGVPLTTPDGQSQVDNIPFQLIENVEIMKSLSSTRYGNASVKVGEGIVGRVVDTLGNPIDGKGELKGDLYEMHQTQNTERFFFGKLHCRQFLKTEIW